jgi:hypothetical protein
MTQNYAWNLLMWTEMGDLGAFLHELPDEEFDRPSLCDGWKVRGDRHRLGPRHGPCGPGSGEAILMAASGRSSVLAELDGDGIATLAERVGTQELR